MIGDFFFFHSFNSFIERQALSEALGSSGAPDAVPVLRVTGDRGRVSAATATGQERRGEGSGKQGGSALLQQVSPLRGLAI